VTFDPDELPAQGPVIRDTRRIDPVTGEVRERHDAAAPDTAPAGDGGHQQPEADADAASSVETELAERTADLQRLQAEYLNYKRRVDRDRENARKNAVASTVSSLLPVLDDIARAREHEELTGGFKAVADSFERSLGQLGLVAFGEVGDEFDPRIHEALAHSYSDDVKGPTCQLILQVGYRIDDRVLRPARVAVAEPPEPPAAAPPEEGEAQGNPVAPQASDLSDPLTDDASDLPPYDNEM
jgi:molecular chaperone GrpE